MTQKARFRKVDVQRAAAGMVAAGFDAFQIRIAPDGQIDIIAGGGANRSADANPWDEALDNGAPPLAP